MAVPKRRKSRANTRHRRSQWKAAAPDLVPITIRGREVLVPRPSVRAYQRGYLDGLTAEMESTAALPAVVATGVRGAR